MASAGPPFQPPVFVNTVPKGNWNTYTGPQEDGPSPYLPKYAGQDQTSRINVSAAKPPREWGPGAADPVISNSYGSYASDGYRDH